MSSKRQIGPSFTQVIDYSFKKDRSILDMRDMDELEARFGYNGGSPCDVLEGPCSCGAYHAMDWKRCRNKVTQAYLTIANAFDIKLGISQKPIGSKIISSLRISQNQPSIEVLACNLLEPASKKKLREILRNTSSKEKLVLREEKDVAGNCTYQLFPDYKKAKHYFGFLE